MHGSSKLITAITTVALSATGLQAAVVWSEDFSDDTVGSAPVQKYNITSGNDWTTNSGIDFSQTVVNLGSGESPDLAYSAYDNVTTNSASGYIPFSRFKPFNTATPGLEVLNVSFDMRVDWFLGSGASTFRVVVSDGAARHMVIGFGQANIDGQTGNEMFFYAAAGNTNGPTPSAANALGIDFGQYNATVGDDNDTNDAFYRFTLRFEEGSGTVKGTVAPVGSPESALEFERSLLSDVFSFSSAGGTGADTFSIILPQSGRGQLYVDNISISTAAVPEPSMVATLFIGAAALLRRRR